MKKATFFLGLFLFTIGLQAQTKYSTKTGQAFFDAGTGVENISATNKAVLSAFDASNGKIQFSLNIKGFEFWSELLQQHFNENYMESDKYPKSTFSGTITNIQQVNFSKNGTYPVTVKGTLEIHGVMNQVEVEGTMKVAGNTINAVSEFVVKMKDYKITIPSVVEKKLAKSAKIKITCSYTATK